MICMHVLDTCSKNYNYSHALCKRTTVACKCLRLKWCHNNYDAHAVQCTAKKIFNCYLIYTSGTEAHVVSLLSHAVLEV